MLLVHTVMTSGMATISGSVLAAFVGFGIKTEHLISASLLSAPAAVAMSKLIYPETKVPKTKVGTKGVFGLRISRAKLK